MNLGDMRSNSYTQEFQSTSPEAQHSLSIARNLIEKVESLDKFLEQTGNVIRRSVDEVIDMPRSQRYSLDHIEKTEKTYIGTKVEILFRHQFNLPKGKKLDLKILDHEVDIKNTIGTSWMIPQEAINEYCLLIKINDKKGIFSIGIVFCKKENLTSGTNRDKKHSISSGNNSILWIGRDIPMQVNFFESLSPEICLQLTDLNISGAERIRRLCRLVPNTIFSRYIIECIAQQKDPLKRMRGNGGARDIMSKEGIYVLSGKYDKDKLKNYGFDKVGPEEWVAVHPSKLDI